jgi:hypothetical protein
MNMYDEPQIAESRSSGGRYERLTAQTLRKRQGGGPLAIRRAT